MSRAIRVHIIGGGCAALTAAFELTQPIHGGRYHVTVHQQGWRLGGKGASGRGVHDRIEEHGLHVWMGWYENAFALMRAVYDELGRQRGRDRMPEWSDAFEPAPRVGLTDERLGEWAAWTNTFPPLPGLPGDAALGAASDVASTADYLLRALRVVSAHLAEVYGLAPPVPPIAAPAAAALRRAEHALSQVAIEVGPRVVRELLDAAAALLEHLAWVEVVRASATALLQATQRLLSSTEGPTAREARGLGLAELVVAAALGVVTERVDRAEQGLDVLAEEDLTTWLRRHGASDRALRSPFLRGLHSLAFAYSSGDSAQPIASAGPALRLILRMFFGYRQSVFFRMNAGMGDVVFAPLYEVLRRRGVRFEFFSRLENVGLSRGVGGRHVETLDFSVQAEPLGGEYRPLVDVGGLPCWPAEPDWRQLRGGARLRAEGWRFESHGERRAAGRRRLRVGRDFDFAVLGVGGGAVPYLCRELVAADPRWANMTQHLRTVATQSLQLWLRPTMAELGWAHGPIVMTAYVDPFDTWADMTHLLPEESWGDRVSSLAYFCNVLPDAELAGVADDEREARAEALVRRKATHFIERHLPVLWPQGAGARAGLVSMYSRANTNPSDRYTLSPPGGSQHRISPLDPTYDNFTVCGDWTACGLDFGCVEAAVVSGRLAAHALSRSPPLSSIVGYDGP